MLIQSLYSTSVRHRLFLFQPSFLLHVSRTELLSQQRFLSALIYLPPPRPHTHTKPAAFWTVHIILLLSSSDLSWWPHLLLSTIYWSQAGNEYLKRGELGPDPFKVGTLRAEAAKGKERLNRREVRGFTRTTETLKN